MKYKQITKTIRFTNVFDKIKEYQFANENWKRFLPGLYKSHKYMFILKPGKKVIINLNG